MGFGARGLRIATLALTLGLTATSGVCAHPHVWITVKSQIAFTPDGKIKAVIHDWVFDEMYSSFATQGLAKPGELVKREQFARSPRRTREPGRHRLFYDAQGRREGGRVRVGVRLLDGGAARPSGRVPCHFAAEVADPAGQIPHAARRRPGIFHRFRIRRQGAGHARVRRPPAAPPRSPNPSRSRPATSKKLSESFFTNLAPGANFGFKMASAAIIACP